MKINAVKGFRDVLPGETELWSRLEDEARRVFRSYGYAEIRIPLLERTELFSRSVGETTDIVEKEMYTFEDVDGTSLTLRPEGTASVVRAYVEHGIYGREPVSKLFYLGPMFRRERPQKGRLRQFSPDRRRGARPRRPAVDAELLVMLADYFAALGLATARLEINSLGDAHVPARLSRRAASLGGGAQGRALRRLQAPARTQSVAPARLQGGLRSGRATHRCMIDHLCEACAEHFTAVRALLDGESVALTSSTRAWCAASTTTAAPRSRSWPRGSARRTRSAAAAATTGWCTSLGGPIGAPGSASRSASSGSLLALAGAEVATRFDCSSRRSASARKRARFASRRELRRGGLRVEIEPGRKSLKSQMRHADKLGRRFRAHRRRRRARPRRRSVLRNMRDQIVRSQMPLDARRRFCARSGAGVGPGWSARLSSKAGRLAAYATTAARRAATDVGRERHGDGLGADAARSRRRRVRRSARPHRHRAAGVQSRAESLTPTSAPARCAASTSSPAAGGWQRGRRRRVNPNLPTGEIEMLVDEVQDPERDAAAAVPDRRRERRRREHAAQVPLPRPAPTEDAEEFHAPPSRSRRRCATTSTSRASSRSRRRC